jgi:nicotinate-nucleotide pyrophosphorylase (carboxylating)
MELSDRIIQNALIEDIGDGDHTTRSTVPPDTAGAAVLMVKEDGVIAGIHVALRVFQLLDPDLVTEVYLKDGQTIHSGDQAFKVMGKVHSILMAERLVLNFMQRMSGIATQTRKYVDAVAGYNCRILDTRKTTPNLRYFEKEAVKLGGAENHRFGLFDMILIKDNHIDFAGGIANALSDVQNYLKRNQKDLRIEIEARSLRDVELICSLGGVHRIMLDNFTPADMREAVTFIAKRYETEASGGITLVNIREYAATGVDFISVGALTHQIHSLDLSLKAMKP